MHTTHIKLIQVPKTTRYYSENSFVLDVNSDQNIDKNGLAPSILPNDLGKGKNWKADPMQR